MDRTIDVVASLWNGGVRSVYLGDSVGMEDARYVGTGFSRILDHFPRMRLVYHVITCLA